MNEAAPASTRRVPARRTAGRAQLDQRLDPYQQAEKLHDGTVCRECGAVYRAGRWHWAKPAESARATLCSACRRIAEEAPAGSVLLRGAFAPARRQEIVGLARHQEQAERQEHPLNRIISISETGDGILVTTTDIHLPRRIGEALRRAFHGDLNMHFDDDTYFVRVVWTPHG